MKKLKNNFPKITIVIATYNSEKTIKDCLESCLRQDYSNKEIIIADAKSIDGTMRIVKEFNNPALFFFSEHDSGIYVAWNKAIKISKGDWICFLGSDDFWISNDSISKLVEEIDNEKTNFISAKVKVYNSSKKNFFVMGKKWDYKKLSDNINIAHPGSLHRMDLLKKHNLFDNKYAIAGDHDFLIRSGKDIYAKFLDLEIIQMQDSGISNTKPFLAFYESSIAIIRSRDFGILRGIIFFVKSLLKFYIRKFIWKKK